MKEKQLELRMYFFTIYQLTGIQAGIQCGHAALEYAHKFGETELFINFVVNYKTWIILNGGTTNTIRDFEGISYGSLNQIADELLSNDIDFSFFHEPDLNNALTAVCFIIDERVFNYKDYPDFVDWLMDIKMCSEAKEEAIKNNPDLWVKFKLYPETQQEMFPEYYQEWIEFIGGNKNIFLRELIKNKKLA